MGTSLLPQAWFRKRALFFHINNLILNYLNLTASPELRGTLRLLLWRKNLNLHVLPIGLGDTYSFSSILQPQYNAPRSNHIPPAYIFLFQ